MKTTSPRHTILRLSLRELLVLVALVAMLIVSLKYASDVWLAVVMGITMLAFFVSLIVAAVDRGSRQAFAVGFALTMVAYVAVLMTGLTMTPGIGGSTNLKNAEFDQWEGRLPTTRLLRYVHRAVESSAYFDNATGKELPNYDPTKGTNRGAGGFLPVSYREIPPREAFMPIGHCWWALLFGVAGGYFANYVYWRRFREEQKLPADVS